jgi:hypothetical protein
MYGVPKGTSTSRISTRPGVGEDVLRTGRRRAAESEVIRLVFIHQASISRTGMLWRLNTSRNYAGSCSRAMM